MKIVNVCSHSFLAATLSEDSVVLDCGANRGEFACWINEHTRATVHAFEPDPRLIAKQPSVPQVHFRQLAVSSVAGSMRLNLGSNSCSSLRYRETGKQDSLAVQTIDLPTYCAREGLGKIDLLKLDIEGAELDVLPALPPDFLQRVVQITVEFHDFIDRSDRPKIRRTIEYLRQQRFHYISFSVWSYGDILLINERLLRLSWCDKLSLRFFGKYIPGFKRVLAKLLGIKAHRSHGNPGLTPPSA